MINRHHVGAAAALTVTGLAASLVVAGPVWEETGVGTEAGGTTSTAQTTTGSGTLGRIKGSLSDGAGPSMPDFEDMYLIRICDPEAFFASTAIADGGTADFNTQLFLFRADPVDPLVAFGATANDDHPSIPTVRSRVTLFPNDGSPAKPSRGLYYIAVSGFDREPFSSPMPQGLMFFEKEPGEISGPDGPGGKAPHFGWATLGEPSATGSYDIRLQGVTFGSVPSVDCNENGIVDACDIVNGFSLDQNGNGIPDECERGVTGDVDGDGDVDFDDLVALLASWGPCPGCPADFDNDGQVGFADLLALLARFGT